MLGMEAKRIVLLGPNVEAHNPPPSDPNSCPILRMLAKINLKSLEKIMMYFN
jgi:hypothetical protein